MKYDFETVMPRYNLGPVGAPKWFPLIRSKFRNDADVIPFSVADMDFVVAPEIRNALKDFIDKYVLGYAAPIGVYNNSVCGWMKRRYDFDAKPEWILPSHGIVAGFHAAVQAFTEEGDGVILMTPTYHPMYAAIRNNKRTLVENKLVLKGSRYEIDFDDFEKKAKDDNTKMFIMSNPHNPVGRVWTRDELERIARICNDNNVLVISDEIHADLIMPGYKHTLYANISEEAKNNCIICTAPSKTFNLAGLQISNLFVPNPDLRKTFNDFMVRASGQHPVCNVMGYKACQVAYDECEEWLEEALKVIYTNKELICEFLSKEFPMINVITLEGTYLLWMDFRPLGIDYKELERINHQEAGLFFDEGYMFGEGGTGFERWNLACPTRYIRSALERMKAVYPKYIK